MESSRFALVLCEKIEIFQSEQFIRSSVRTGQAVKRTTEMDDSSVIFGNGVHALIKSDYRRNNDPNLLPVYRRDQRARDTPLTRDRPEVSSLFPDSFTTFVLLRGRVNPIIKLTCRVVKWGVLSRNLDLNPINFEFLASLNELRSMRRRCSTTVIWFLNPFNIESKARFIAEARVFFLYPECQIERNILIRLFSDKLS